MDNKIKEISYKIKQKKDEKHLILIGEEYKLNEVVKIKNEEIYLRVEEDNEQASCDECFFIKFEEKDFVNGCKNTFCVELSRKDGKSIIYKKIELWEALFNQN